RGDRDDESGPPVEPDIACVRAHALHDVPGPDDGARGRRQAIGGDGEQVLLAAVHVHDVRASKSGHQAAEIRHVGSRTEATREVEVVDAVDAFGTGAVDHRHLGAATAAQRDLVSASLQLAAHADCPVGVRGPAATGHELENSHRSARYTRSTVLTTRSGPKT